MQQPVIPVTVELLQAMDPLLPAQLQTVITLPTTQVMVKHGLALVKAHLMAKVMVKLGKELVNNLELEEEQEVDLLGHRQETQEQQPTHTIDTR